MEIPQSIQSILPENKSHFLNEIVEDMVIPDKAKKSKDLNINDNESNIKIPEATYTLDVEKCNNSIENKPQEIINENDNNSINSTPEKLICDSETNNELFNKTPLNINTMQTNKEIEKMDVNNDLDSSITEEPLDELKTDVTEMLKDFIDSD